jgi:hypothetical protein
MEIRRRLDFIGLVARRAVPRLNSVVPTVALLILIVGGVLGAVGSALTAPTSPWPFWVSLLLIGLGILDAAYREWDRWAPRAGPRLNHHA